MNIDGVLVPVVTPFNADDSLNLPALEKLIETFIAQGGAGIVVCDSTGEYYALTAEERAQVRETSERVAKGRITLIAAMNALSPAVAIARARHAQDLGYEGLMLSPAPYSLPQQHEVLAYSRAVAGPTPPPIIMYRSPERVGGAMPLENVVGPSRVPAI